MPSTEHDSGASWTRIGLARCAAFLRHPLLFTFPCPVLSQLKTILETILGDVEGLYLRVWALEHRPAFKRRRCGLRARVAGRARALWKRICDWAAAQMSAQSGGARRARSSRPFAFVPLFCYIGSSRRVLSRVCFGVLGY